MFVYELPYEERSELVALLNAGDAWKELAGRCLGYSVVDIQRFSEARYKPGDSPAEALLVHFGQRNGTVEELILHLHKLGLYQIMAVLWKYVPEDLQGSFHVRGDRGERMRPETEACPKQGLSPLRRASEKPCLPAATKERLIQSNINDTSEENKVINKSFGLPTSALQDSTVDYNALPHGPISPATPAVPPLSVATTRQSPPPPPARNDSPGDAPQLAPNIAIPCELASSQGATAGPSKTENSSLSLLRQRVPSGVPLPEDEFFLKNIPFETLKKACHDFNREIPGVLLGHGGFGEVFRGKLHGQDVAVKRILEEKRFQLGSEAYHRCINQAITELHTLHSYPAENILPLLAISFDRNFVTDPCLVYQFMPNGSVADRLKQKQRTPPLTWDQRANIALGTSRGLMHLHANNIIHGDIKSGNILLDRHFEPKIGDFGLARGGPENTDASFKMVSIVKGTQAYLPEDYIRSHQLTAAVDTFCFGIFMFELVSAKSPSYPIPGCKDNLRIRDVMLQAPSPEPWVDKSIPPSYWSQLLFYIGKDCTKRTRKARPLMKTVLEAFDKLVQQPTSAMALQSYYDEHKIRNNAVSETQASTTMPGRENSFDHSPKVLDNPSVSGPGSEVLFDPTSERHKADASDSAPHVLPSSLFVIDQQSLPNLSMFLSGHQRCSEAQGQPPTANEPVSDLSGVPNLSMLKISRSSEDRLSLLAD